jgi:hypothetical protein
MQQMKPNSDRSRSSGTHGRRPEDAARAAKCLERLRERFPHLKSFSLTLLEKDETFRELCEEHTACTEVIERLTRSGSDDAMLREYSALRLRIERELLDYVSAHPDPGRR